MKVQKSGFVEHISTSESCMSATERLYSDNIIMLSVRDAGSEAKNEWKG